MGSGDYYRWNTKRTVESCTAADVRQMIRDVQVRAGQESVSLVVDQDLENRTVIRLEWTPCHFGGSRGWFLCPACKRRCALVYWIFDRWGCRTCQQLTYYSSQGSPWVRSVRRANRVRNRLVISEGRAWRPKGMHWRTFMCLVEEDRRLNSQAGEAVTAMLGRQREDHDRFIRGLVGCTEAEFRAGLRQGERV